MERIERSLCMRDISDTHAHTRTHTHIRTRTLTQTEAHSTVVQRWSGNTAGPGGPPALYSCQSSVMKAAFTQGPSCFCERVGNGKIFCWAFKGARTVSRAVFHNKTTASIYADGLMLRPSDGFIGGRTDPTTAFLLLKSVFFSCGFSLILLSFFLCFSFLLGFPRPDKPDHQDARACVRVSQWLLLWSRCRTWWVWNLRSSCGSQPQSSWEALSKNTTNLYIYSNFTHLLLQHSK